MGFKKILQYFGLFALLITSFLGGLLLLGENSLIFVIFGALVLSFILYYLVNLLIKKREETHQEISTIILLLIIYLLISIFCGFLSVHFLTVKFGAEKDLRLNGNDKLETIRVMNKKFQNSVDQLKRDLTMKVNTKLSLYNSSNKNSDIILELDYDLRNTYKFRKETLSELKNSNIKKTTNNWIESYITNALDLNSKKDKNINLFDKTKSFKEYYSKNKNVFDNNQYTKIHEVYYQLDDKIQDSKKLFENEFNLIVSKYDLNNSVFTDLEIPSSLVPLNNLKGMYYSYGKIWHILVYFIIHFLILFPLLMTRKVGLKPKSDEDPTPDL